jgi:DnaD/phage-associated family protein
MQMDANAMQNQFALMQIDATDYAKDFVQNCIDEYELFASDGSFFWSNSLIKRMDKKNDVSEKRRAAAQKRWAKNNNDEENNANAMQMDANAMQNNASAMQSDAIKGKESKEKESKVNNNNNNNTELNDTARIIQFWDDNGFGFNNINAKNKLLDWLDEPKLKEAGPIILKALEIASAANKRNYKYVEGILKNWFNQGCTTLADVDTYQTNFEQGKGNGGDKWEGVI